MSDDKLHREQAERMAQLTFNLLEQCHVKQERLAESLHLTVAEFKLLLTFKSDQMVSVGELANRMELSKSRLTRILDGLVKKKIVSRVNATTDRRVLEIRLTAPGRKIQAALNKSYIQTHNDILALLPESGRDSVLMAMERLGEAMKKWIKR